MSERLAQTASPRIRRYWFQADASELCLRVSQLEAELSVAAALLERRQEERHSEVVARLLPKWRALLAETPPVIQEATA